MWGEHDVRDSSVGKVTRLWLEHRGILVRFPAQARDICLFHSVQEGLCSRPRHLFNENRSRCSQCSARWQGHLHLLPSLSRAFTACKRAVFKILYPRRRQYGYQGHDYPIFRTSLWRFRQNFLLKRRHPQYIAQVHILSLIKLLQLLFFLWWRFDLSRIGRGWKHRDQVLIFEHRFPMAHNSS